MVKSKSAILFCIAQVFHEVAYKARNRKDILAGIDEFLEQVTVLPPGEWDASIRIEPPLNVPKDQVRSSPYMSSNYINLQQ